VINIGLNAESYKSVSFNFKVNPLGAPYVSGDITPNQCYSQGGSTATVVIANFPPTANVADIVATFEVGGSIVSNAAITATQHKQSVFEGSIQELLELSLLIPTSPDTTSHTEALALRIPGQLDVESEFSSVELPQGSFKQNTSPEPSIIDVNGGVEMTIKVKNLGVTSTNVLVAMFGGAYPASINNVSCGSDPNPCERGLVACVVRLTTPSMTSLTNGDSVGLQVYWSDRGVSGAASTSQITVYDPTAASMIGLPSPDVGYATENTGVQVKVLNLAYQGVYPEDAGTVEAYLTIPGSSQQYTVTVVSCYKDTSDGVTFNRIHLTMPPISTTTQVTVSVTVRLKQATSVAASTDFTYHLMPVTASIIERVLPTTGPVDSPNDVLIKLSGFYKTNSIIVEFVDAEMMEMFKWTVRLETIKSTMRTTEFEVISPVVWEEMAYNDDGTPIVLSVRVYPATLSASKLVLGATFDWTYERNTPWIYSLVPLHGLVIGGGFATLEMKVADDIDIENVQNELTIMFGATAVGSNTISATETLSNGVRDSLQISFQVPTSQNTGVVAVTVIFNEELDLPDGASVQNVAHLVDMNTQPSLAMAS